MTAFAAYSPVHHVASRRVRRAVAVGVIVLHAGGVVVLWQPSPEPVAASNAPMMVSFVTAVANESSPALMPAPPVAPRKAEPVLATARHVVPAGAAPMQVADPAVTDAPVTDVPGAHPAGSLAAEGAQGVATTAPSAPVVSTPPSVGAAYLKNPKPLYPLVSMRLGERGVTYLRVQVSPEGRAQQIEVERSSGYSRLDRAAQMAVRDWRFVPAREGDKAVTGWVTFPIIWNLEN